MTSRRLLRGVLLSVVVSISLSGPARSQDSPTILETPIEHAARPEDWEPLGDYLGSHLPPRFIQPGQIITYNDHHTSLAGLVLERVTGVGFPHLLEESSVDRDPSDY